MSDTISLLTVITPVTPGHEDLLDADLKQLWEGPSPFAQLPELHFARWVIIGDVRGNLPHLPRRRQPLRMKYLVYSCGFNGPVSGVLENMRTLVGPTTDSIWTHCVGYPGLTDRDRFQDYFTHNTLPIPHQFIAYHRTVADIKSALDLRQRHIDLAYATQGMDPARLLAAFRKEFP